MAKFKSKEAKYTELLMDLGVYEPAFEPVIHSLAMLERETSRLRTAWKKTAPPKQAPSALDPHYAMIRANERDIQAMRDSLGLTPKGLRRLRGREVDAPVDSRSEISRRLDALAERCGAYDGGAHE